MGQVKRFLSRARGINCTRYECDDLRGKLILVQQAGFARDVGRILEMNEEGFCWFVRQILKRDPQDRMMLIQLWGSF